MANHQLPDDFKCPISLEIMSDPVILSSGHTFDRASITRWLDAGNRSCPITKLPVSDPVNLIPNHALRSLISNYTLVSLPEARPGPNPHFLMQALVSGSSSSNATLDSLDQLSRLCKRDFATRRWLTESGAVAAVLRCLDADEVAVQEKGLQLLLNLSLDDDNKVGLVAEGAVGKLVAAVHNGGGDSRALAATVLTSLAVVEVNKATIGAHRSAISGLIGLLRAGSLRERKEAATTLYTLSSFADNRVRAVENFAVPILIQNIRSGLERAVEVLGLLAKCAEGREAMLGHSGLLELLIFVLGSGSSRGVQYALLTVNLLCSYSERMRVNAINGGVFEMCCGMLEDDNEKVRRHAKCLLQVLRGLSC